MEKMLESLNRATAKNTVYAADLREKQVRTEIASQLIERGIDDATTILLVLGHVDAADAIVASRIKSEEVDEILNESWESWPRYLVRRMVAEQAQRKQMQAAVENAVAETEDDLPYGEKGEADED